ncbi:hypothetical protein Tco_0668954 [Tanacetum coccineum]
MMGIVVSHPDLFLSSGLERYIHLPPASSIREDAYSTKACSGVVSEQDELPTSVGLDFRARLDGGWMYSGHLEAM